MKQKSKKMKKIAKRINQKTEEKLFKNKKKINRDCYLHMALVESSLPALKLLSKGKVRDVYEVDEHSLLFIATDRLSAFDVVMKNVIFFLNLHLFLFFFFATINFSIQSI